ncbi:MAG: hypothetical protein Q9180_001873 [Flavoplaca navasiana]
MAKQKGDDFKVRLAQACDLSDGADVGGMLKTVRDFIQSLRNPGFSAMLLEDRQLLDQFCDFVSRDEIFGHVKMVVYQFRTPMDENLEILRSSEDTDAARCLFIILSRLEHDHRLPQKFRYGSCYVNEAALMRDRQKLWMELLLSSEEGVEPGSSEEADIHDAHRRVERVLRPDTLAAAEALDDPVPTSFRSDESDGEEAEGYEDETMEG